MVYVATVTDMLPEWSTVDAEEIYTGGSFDASGAFLSSKVSQLCNIYWHVHLPTGFRHPATYPKKTHQVFLGGPTEKTHQKSHLN